MFRKLLGITAALAVMATIVMVAITPRRKGFFPNLFGFLRHAEQISTSQPEAPEKSETQMDSGIYGEPEIPADTLSASPECDTLVRKTTDTL